MVTPHSLPKSVFLHLLPGFLAGVLYFILAPVVERFGYPSVMALTIAGIVVLLPLELGILLHQKRSTGQKWCNEIIPYCRTMPVKQYLIWIPVIVVLTGILFTLLHFVNDAIKPLFRWLPLSKLDMGMGREFATPKLIVTYILFFLFIVLIIPATEELYFRGYLLPRMPVILKKWGSPAHSLLFALYHAWTPWMFIGRAVGLLPLVYAVKWKRNIFLGIWVHCLLNSVDLIQALVYLIG